ncbi:MAG: tetratricopeptide repeat protein [Phycisphaerae bacterium]
MTDRISAIQAMLAKSPDDVFLRYSLGMEYAASQQYEQALAAFRKCIELDADYVAAYVEAGKSLRSLGRLDEARETFTAALTSADKLSEGHTANYIRAQIAGLPRKT